MTRPPSRAYVIVLFLVLAAGIGAVAGLRELRTIEHRVTTIEQRRTTIVVAMPCVRGEDAACRRFVSLLLSDATRSQLEQLLRVQAIHVPARGLPHLVAQLQGLLHPRGRHHHHRPPPPAPPLGTFPLIPAPAPAPEGVMPGNPTKGLPGPPSGRDGGPAR